MCRLQNIALCDYKESMTTRQTDIRTDRQTDAGQSDPYMPLCFAGDTKNMPLIIRSRGTKKNYIASHFILKLQL